MEKWKFELDVTVNAEDRRDSWGILLAALADMAYEENLGGNIKDVSDRHPEMIFADIKWYRIDSVANWEQQD